MTRVIHDSRDTTLETARTDGDSLWLDRNAVERATGWAWKEHGLCHDDACLPLPRRSGRPLVDAERLDVAGVWRHAGWPVARSLAGDIWVLGAPASQRAAALSSLSAPDFELPDLEGRRHRLFDYRGRRVFLVTWASWCGCRGELRSWQTLFEAVKQHAFTVLAIALDRPDAARPWIEAAAPSYPCVIDAEHRTAELYNLVNVPQAVWIDEAGRVVRPPEPAGMTDGFRAMDRHTFALPEPARKQRDRAKATYLDAVRDWAIHGAASPHVLGADAVTARINTPDAAVTEAHACFRLGMALEREGRTAEAAASFAEATRLHPESWAMWRQTAEKAPNGLAVGAAFWQRVDALGERNYYEPSELTAADVIERATPRDRRGA